LETTCAGELTSFFIMSYLHRDHDDNVYNARVAVNVVEESRLRLSGPADFP
jgi:hypothetical protein